MSSGGNSFSDFSENQLAIDFAFICKPAWWNATVSLFPLVLISFGGTAFPQKYLGNGIPHIPLDYTTEHTQSLHLLC